MNINRHLKALLAPLGLPVAFNVDTHHRERCLTFNYVQQPFQFADNKPIYWKYLVQVHLFLPLTEDSLSLRSRIAAALVSGGLTWPEVQDLTGENSRQSSRQHILFESECIDKWEV